MLELKEIKRFIDEDKTSESKQNARKGVQYYESEHDIKDYKIFYFDEDGQLKEDETRSNERISHPFFTELTDQCVQYMLSGQEKFVMSDKPELQKMLDEYFDDDFKMELNDLLTAVGVQGFSYLYRYMGEDMKSKFRFADGISVVEAPSRYTSDKKDYVIYYYFWKKTKRKTIYKVEVWDNENVYFYYMVNGKIVEDKETEPRPHILYEEGKDVCYDTFKEIPFIRLDNNIKQQSDLKVIKDIIDDYDLMACGLSNNIQDVAEGIYVVKGFDGNNLSELTHNIKYKKQVAVGEGGDVDIKTINIPYEARKVKLELDEKNIYRFGMGFDSSKSDASNITNMVIKGRYTLLNMKANKKQAQLNRMMKKIIKIVLDEINTLNESAYELKDVYLNFERVIPTNEVDNATIAQTEASTKQIKINTLLSLATYLDNETLMQNICDQLDIDYEEIKDKLPKEDEVSVDDAQQELNQVTDEQFEA